MNDRKQHVINVAHQLFIEKGFQATSIQDILEYSGIAKGTFYNYFSSKNELLIALIKMLYKEIEAKRNELLIGQNPSNIEIFMKQIELQIEMIRTSNIGTLFEEVFFINDLDLKDLIRRGNLRKLRWLYERFTDIFGESKEPYLLDCAVMFMGILNNNIKYYSMAHESNIDIHRVVRYSVERLVKMVEEVEETGEQLIEPDLLTEWYPNCGRINHNFQQNLRQKILTLKKKPRQCKEQEKFIQLLNFIQNELLHSEEPRKYLLESVFSSLKAENAFIDKNELQELEQMVADYFKKSDRTN